MRDGLCAPPDYEIGARHLLSLVCIAGGLDCPMMPRADAEPILTDMRRDPSLRLRLCSDADTVPYFRTADYRGGFRPNPQDVQHRKRDLDVLQRLGLLPGDTRRARYLYELLFQRVPSTEGVCSYETDQWGGCPLSKSVYEDIREQGWQAMVYEREQAEKDAYRERNVTEIEGADRIFIRPHHIMCYACWYGDGGTGVRPEDTLAEIFQRIREHPGIPVTLVEGNCMACDCCDGFHADTGRCVHSGGLIRDYKKDLDVFQRLGMMPGDTLPARELLSRLFQRITSTKQICGYGDGRVTAEEWRICRSPEGSEGYARARERGML